MKLRKILLLSLGMALCAGGGVGAALAATTSTPDSAVSSGEFDKAVYLYWGHNENSVSIESMTTLQPTVPAYRHLVVSPQTSKSVTGYVDVTFVLGEVEVEGKTAVSTGVTVSVYALTSESAITDENYVSLISGDPVVTLTNASAETKTGKASIQISSDSAVHETVQHYAIKVVYSGEQLGANEKLSARLDISQTYRAS
jgi:hypothetical protein